MRRTCLPRTAFPLRTELAEKRNSPTQLGAPLGSGVGDVFASDLQDLSPPQSGAISSAAAVQDAQGSTKPWTPKLPDPYTIPKEFEGILAKPEATSDLLASALRAAITKIG